MRSRRHWEKGNGTVMEIFGMGGTSRQRKAFFAALVGLIINLILGMVKIFAGWQSGFLSVIGDGFNNITDVGAVILLMMTFHYASKPSDKEHPFGHGRLEYVNSTVMSAIILYVGITLLVESVQKILHPEDSYFSIWTASALTVGIIAKLFLTWWYKRAGENLKSEAFNAYSADSFSDILSTTGVLVAACVEYFSGYHVDGIMGVIMSLFILYTGYGIMKEALNSIIGATPDAEMYEKIKTVILETPGVYGVHDLIVHDYGPENHFASAHVELDSNLTLVEGHELAETVMTKLRNEFNIQAVVHADPKAVSNPKEMEYMRDLEAAIYRTGLPVSYHDFFVVEKEEGIYISFELELKGPCDKSDEEMYQMILTEILKSNPKYFIEMMVDRNFISGKVYVNRGGWNILLNNCKAISVIARMVPAIFIWISERKHECDKYDKIMKTEQCIKICNYKYFHVRKPYG